MLSFSPFFPGQYAAAAGCQPAQGSRGSQLANERDAKKKKKRHSIRYGWMDQKRDDDGAGYFLLLIARTYFSAELPDMIEFVISKVPWPFEERISGYRGGRTF